MLFNPEHVPLVAAEYQWMLYGGTPPDGLAVSWTCSPTTIFGLFGVIALARRTGNCPDSQAMEKFLPSGESAEGCASTLPLGVPSEVIVTLETLFPNEPTLPVTPSTDA